MVRHRGLSLDWFGYATARIAGDDGVVYTDPGRYGTLTGEWAERYGGADHPSGGPYDAGDGDVVLVTHDHHYDDDGVERVASDDATLVVYEAVSADAIGASGGRDVREPEALPYDVVRVGYGDEVNVGGVDVRVTPAYNRPDGPNASGGEPLHPEGFGCGFVAAVDGVRCFWPGDSDALDEHRDIDADVFMPSISRSFTMDRHDAADLAERIDPGLVLPIHYNTFPDLRADSGAFTADVAKRGVPVALAERDF
ncbi:MBL fold metallo-hydrolase [Halostella litorea]|uniref:MBL fold metallo-hydrolase n=1 Tax=Halostella litorea TaxID=2528831 RepID=UPI001091A722|nr:MBL fold metallo-hydrolase [Halostella litorea]